MGRGEISELPSCLCYLFTSDCSGVCNCIIFMRITVCDLLHISFNVSEHLLFLLLPFFWEDKISV